MADGSLRACAYHLEEAARIIEQRWPGTEILPLEIRHKAEELRAEYARQAQAEWTDVGPTEGDVSLAGSSPPAFRTGRTDSATGYTAWLDVPVPGEGRVQAEAVFAYIYDGDKLDGPVGERCTRRTVWLDGRVIIEPKRARELFEKAVRDGDHE